MSKIWKVGDRARLVRVIWAHNQHMLRAEGVVVGAPFFCEDLRKICAPTQFLGYAPPPGYVHWSTPVENLEPLVDDSKWALDQVKHFTQPNPSILQQQTEEERIRVKKDKQKVRSFIAGLN
jgi:hypothetical protein